MGPSLLGISSRILLARICAVDQDLRGGPVPGVPQSAGLLCVRNNPAPDPHYNSTQLGVHLEIASLRSQ